MKKVPPPIFSIKSIPFITKLYVFSGLIIPHSMAIALAVSKLSPVTIRTLTPAALHWAIAPGTSCLRMSFIPNKAIMVSPDCSTLKTPLSSFSVKSKKSIVSGGIGYLRILVFFRRLLWYGGLGWPCFQSRFEFGFLGLLSFRVIGRRILAFDCILQALFHWLLLRK